MPLDARKNFGKVTASGGYNASALSISLLSGHALRLPNPAVSGEFNLTWWNSTDYPDPSDDPKREIVRCVAITGNVLTIERAQEDTLAATKNTSGKVYKLILSLTTKTIDDIEDAIGSKIDATEKGQAGGVAELDENGKVPADQIPSESDPVFSGSAAFGVTSEKISDWDTAFGWGDHAGLYDLIGAADGAVSGHNEAFDHSLIATALQSETDPVFSGSPSAGISSDDISDWNTAFGWGNHAGLYDLVGAGATAVSGHELAYDHSLIATALQAETDPAFTAWLDGSPLAGLVPYTGATGDVDLGAQKLTTAILDTPLIQHIPTITEGEIVTFTRRANHPEDVDPIVPSQVEIARGNGWGYIYNSILEGDENADYYYSPLDTEWFTNSLANDAWSSYNLNVADQLTYQSFAYAYGDYPEYYMIGMEAIMHVKSVNRYFKIKFLSWDEGGSGAFSYTRQEVTGFGTTIDAPSVLATQTFKVSNLFEVNVQDGGVHFYPNTDPDVIRTVTAFTFGKDNQGVGRSMLWENADGVGGGNFAIDTNFRVGQTLLANGIDSAELAYIGTTLPTTYNFPGIVLGTLATRKILGWDAAKQGISAHDWNNGEYGNGIRQSSYWMDVGADRDFLGTSNDLYQTGYKLDVGTNVLFLTGKDNEDAWQCRDDLHIVSTDSLGAEKLGAINATNCTVGTGWSLSGGVAYKNAAGTGTFVFDLADMISPMVVGEFYQVVFTEAATNPGVTVTCGGVTLATNLTASGVTTTAPFRCTNASAPLTFTPYATTTRFNLRSISLKRVTDGNEYVANEFEAATIRPLTAYKAVDGTLALAGAKVYYVADSSGGAVNRKLTFKDGLLVSET